MEFSYKAFFVGDALAEQPDATVATVLAELRTLFAAHHGADGIAFDAMAWLVSAQA